MIKYKCKHKSHCCFDDIPTKQCTDLTITDIILDLAVQVDIGLKIFGTKFNHVKKIIVNSQIITNFIIISNSEIRVTISAHCRKSFYIEVATDKHISNQFIYKLVDSPSITINPSSGVMAPNILITIFGSNLTSLRYITFNNIKLYKSTTVITIISDTLASFIMPFMNVIGDVPISVTNAGGTSNIVYYTVIPAPII